MDGFTAETQRSRPLSKSRGESRSYNKHVDAEMNFGLRGGAFAPNLGLR
jgi:hypothetical protein